ncbi:aldehyde reductase [Tessaracoccus terricola]
MSALVLVTDGVGYLGQWCIVEALGRGLRVRAVAPAVDAVPGILEAVSAKVDVTARLETIVLDPLRDAGWADAARGATYVVHTGHVAARESESEVNQQVTTRILQAASSAGVERVVVTSTVGAARPADDATTADEAVWTDPTNSAGDGAIAATVERSAHETAERLGIELVTLLPGHMVGAPVGPGGLERLWLIGDLVSGRSGDVPKRGVEIVDVRDVAKAHVSALVNPKATGRYLVPGEFYWMVEIARVLRDRLGERARHVPTTVLSGWRATIVGWLTPRNNRPPIGSETEVVHDSSRARRELDWRPRNTDDSIIETAELFLAEGQ